VVEQDRVDVLISAGVLADQAWRSRTWVRASAMCAGGIHDSGSVPACSSSRRWRASVWSVLARRLGRAAPGVGRVRAEPGAFQFLGDEPPAGGGLQGEVRLLAAEPSKPSAQLHAHGRAELPTAGLAGIGVQ
jgi:hypothetical protein